MTGPAPEPGPDPGEVARSLGLLLDAVDAGELEATDLERGYLAGARDALRTVSERAH